MPRYLDLQPVRRTPAPAPKPVQAARPSKHSLAPLLPFLLLLTLSDSGPGYGWVLPLALVLLWFFKKRPFRQTWSLPYYYLLQLLISLLAAAFFLQALFPACPLFFTSLISLIVIWYSSRRPLFSLPPGLSLGLCLFTFLSWWAAGFPLPVLSFSYHPLIVLALLTSLIPTLPSKPSFGAAPLILSIIFLFLTLSRPSPFHPLLGDLDHIVPTLLFLLLALFSGQQYSRALRPLPLLTKSRPRFLLGSLLVLSLLLYSFYPLDLLWTTTGIAGAAALLLVPLFL